MPFQNCWECVETIIEVGTAGLDSDMVGEGQKCGNGVGSVCFGHCLMFQSTLF